MAAADKTATKTIYTTVETPLCFLAFEHCMSASIEGFNDEAIKKRIEALALTCPKSRRFFEQQGSESIVCRDKLNACSSSKG